MLALDDREVDLETWFSHEAWTGRWIRRNVGHAPLQSALGELAALGYCQPDGTFITTLADLRQWRAEMARSGEAGYLDGLATRVQRPSGWANRRVWTMPSGTPTPASAWRC